MGFQELQTYSCFPSASLHMPKGKPPPCVREDVPCRVGSGQPRHRPRGGHTQRGPGTTAPCRGLGPARLCCALPSQRTGGSQGQRQPHFLTLPVESGRNAASCGPWPCETLGICPMLTARMKAKGTSPRGGSDGQGCPAELPSLGTAPRVLGTAGDVSRSRQDASGPVQVRPLALLSPPEPHGRRSARRRGFTRKQPILVAQSG